MDLVIINAYSKLEFLGRLFKMGLATARRDIPADNLGILSWQVAMGLVGVEIPFHLNGSSMGELANLVFLKINKQIRTARSPWVRQCSEMCEWQRPKSFQLPQDCINFSFVLWLAYQDNRWPAFMIEDYPTLILRFDSLLFFIDCGRLCLTFTLFWKLSEGKILGR